MRTEDIPTTALKLARKLGASDSVAKVKVINETMIRFANNEVSVIKTLANVFTTIYVDMRGRRAAGSITEVSPEAIRKAVERIAATAKMSPPGETYASLPRGPFKYNSKLLRASGLKTAPDKLVGYTEQAINEALASGAKRTAGSLIQSVERTILETSAGVSASYSKSGIELSIRAIASDIASGHFVSVAEREKEFNPGEAGRIAGEISKMALQPVQGDAGKYEALIGPMTFAHIMEQVAVLASAFQVDAGISFLSSKIDTDVASANLTLADDPTLVGTYGSRPFDDEGLPTRRNIIIDQGVLKTYLHNSVTSKKHNSEKTASAGLIVPVPFNVEVSPGTKSFDDLVSEIDDGVYVTNDWYLRYQNYRTGDFSTIPRDGMFRIKKGSIESPIRELRLSDNMLRMIRSIRSLGRERYFVKWWEIEIPTYAPHAIIDGVNFTKSTL